MTRHAYNIFIVVLILSFAPKAWAEQYFIYSPKSVPQEQAKQTKDGILVRSVPVQNGDSLYSISQKITGRGMYYPQILLFNDIKNPHDIRPGDTVRVPIPKDRPVTVEQNVPGQKGNVSIPATKEPPAAEAKKVPADKRVPVKQLAKAPAKHSGAVPVAAAKRPSGVKPGSGQLSELALSEFKPSAPAAGKKKRIAARPESTNASKPLRSESSWKEKTLALKKQPITEEEVRPSLATRQPELRQAIRIPISPEEIRPMIAAARFQDVEPAYQTSQPPPMQPLSAMESSDSQRLFEQAIKAYRQDDCIKALDLFGNFLSVYPDLPQASDATLYKAECFMKLSKQ